MEKDYGCLVKIKDLLIEREYPEPIDWENHYLTSDIGEVDRTSTSS